jgi:hypothetical protein
MSKPLPVVYIAGPYRAKTAWGIERNVRRAEGVALDIASFGAGFLCPHSMCRFFQGTVSDDYWLAMTLELLRRADAVALVPGWDVSPGARAEVEEANRLQLSVFDWSSASDREDFARWLKAGGWR